ncbi:hypothetical protein [Orenia marismortui]|uniref:hypothetical protein n=1 Tax=Orenia marismortui TaxID=46469 RepID=UPI00036E3D98|nr:hypothetical protein [Orenia marismortui]
MDILDLLRSDGSLTINKSLIQKLKKTKVADDRENTKREFRPAGGLMTAAVLSELISRYKYHKKEGQLVNIKGNTKKEDGKREWFFITHNKLEQLIGVSSSQQDLAIDALEKLGLITKKLIGIPAKRHFKINEDAIINFLFGKDDFSKKNKQKIATNPQDDQVPSKMEPSNKLKRKQVSGSEGTQLPAKRELYNTNNNTKDINTILPSTREGENTGQQNNNTDFQEILKYITKKLHLTQLSKGYLLKDDLEEYGPEIIKKACDIAIYTQTERGNYRHGDPEAGVSINSYKFIRCFIAEAKETLQNLSGGAKNGTDKQNVNSTGDKDYSEGASPGFFIN